MRTLIAPEVDMLTVSKSSRVQRRAILGFAPRIGLSIVNYCDLERIDNFYLECQNFRDYFRDPYNKLARPEIFKHHQGKCGITLDRSVDELMKPIKWVEESQPVVYPIEYNREMNLDQGIRLGARYDHASCIKYKR